MDTLWIGNSPRIFCRPISESDELGEGLIYGACIARIALGIFTNTERPSPALDLSGMERTGLVRLTTDSSVK